MLPNDFSIEAVLEEMDRQDKSTLDIAGWAMHPCVIDQLRYMFKFTSMTLTEDGYNAVTFLGRYVFVDDKKSKSPSYEQLVKDTMPIKEETNVKNEQKYLS